MLRWVVLAAALLVTVPPAMAARVNLSGQVTYRERIALPDPAVLEIRLIDQATPGAPPRLEVRAPIGHGQVPLSFGLSFDEAVILPNHSYALIASISTESGLMFRNFEPYVLDPLAPAAPVMIVVNLIASPEPPPSPSIEPPPGPPALLESTWIARAIGDTRVTSRSGPSLTIGPDLRAGGSGGCNSWFAQAQLDGDALRLGPLTSTRRACGETADAEEAAYFAALAAAVAWKVDADGLNLYGADGKTLVHFTR